MDEGSFSISLRKEVKTKVSVFMLKENDLDYDDDGDNDDFTISDFTFDQKTGRAQGKFNIVDKNDDPRNATITGTFDVNLKRYQNIYAQPSFIELRTK